eukprot:4981309-Prymnesium_polylepis.1
MLSQLEYRRPSGGALSNPAVWTPCTEFSRLAGGRAGVDEGGGCGQKEQAAHLHVAQSRRLKAGSQNGEQASH